MQASDTQEHSLPGRVLLILETSKLWLQEMESRTEMW